MADFPEFEQQQEVLAVTEASVAMDTLLLRRLAKQITTMEQLEMILATVENTELRTAMRALLIPMLSFTVETPPAPDSTLPL